MRERTRGRGRGGVGGSRWCDMEEENEVVRSDGRGGIANGVESGGAWGGRQEGVRLKLKGRGGVGYGVVGKEWCYNNKVVWENGKV